MLVYESGKTMRLRFISTQVKLPIYYIKGYYMNGIKVIITFETKPDSSSQFSTLLEHVKLDLPNVNGCRAVRLFAASDNPCIFTLLEEWDSESMHKAHIERVVSSGAWERIAAHLSKDPVSHYFSEL